MVTIGNSVKPVGESCLGGVHEIISVADRGWFTIFD